MLRIEIEVAIKSETSKQKNLEKGYSKYATFNEFVIIKSYDYKTCFLGLKTTNWLVFRSKKKFYFLSRLNLIWKSFFLPAMFSNDETDRRLMELIEAIKAQNKQTI